MYSLACRISFKKCKKLQKTYIRLRSNLIDIVPGLGRINSLVFWVHPLLVHNPNAILSLCHLTSFSSGKPSCRPKRSSLSFNFVQFGQALVPTEVKRSGVETSLLHNSKLKT